MVLARNAPAVTAALYRTPPSMNLLASDMYLPRQRGYAAKRGYCFLRGGSVIIVHDSPTVSKTVTQRKGFIK